MPDKRYVSAVEDHARAKTRTGLVSTPRRHQPRSAARMNRARFPPLPEGTWWHGDRSVTPDTTRPRRLLESVSSVTIRERCEEGVTACASTRSSGDVVTQGDDSTPARVTKTRQNGLATTSSYEPSSF